MRRTLIAATSIATCLIGWPVGAAANDAATCIQGTGDAAIAACDRTLKSNQYKGTERAKLHSARAQALIAKGSVDAAIAALNEAVRLDPKLAHAHAGRGRVYDQKREHDRAIASYSEAYRLDSRYASHLATAYVNRGHAALGRSEYDGAISNYNEALRLDPKLAVYGSRGRAYAGKQDYDRAIADLNEAIRIDPKDASSYYNRGHIFGAKKDYDRAIADLSEAIRIDPGHAFAHMARGHAFVQKRNYDRAIADLSEAIRIDPKRFDTYNLRGVVHLQKGDYDRAIADFDDALKLEPNNVNLRSNRAGAFARTGQFDRALTELDDVIRTAATKTESMFYHRGLAHAGKNDLDKAIVDFSDALKLNSSSARALHQRSLAYAARNDTALAAADGESVKRIDPDFVPHKIPGTQIAALPQNAQPVSEPTDAERGITPGRRVALVIGNGEYQNVPKLPNPPVDGRAMRDTLNKLGFEVVYGENLDKRAMGRLIGEFGAIVKDAEAAIVYFAGHGSTFGDIPYVVPVDAKYDDISRVPNELVQVESLVSELRRANGVRIVILDACRDNEREIELKRQAAAARGEAKRGGDVSRGLAKLQNASGLIVVYSTQHMATAADGLPGANSPFTAALTKHLPSRNVDIKDVLFRTGQEVITSTRGAQRPEIAFSLYESYMLAR